MLVDIYLLKNFNNYFNRKVIRYTDLHDYLEAVGGESGYFCIENVNFNPNDGVSTTQVIGNGMHPFNRNWQPDYMLVVTHAPGLLPAITSRWFVTESRRIMESQYEVSLKRDSIVDYYKEIVEAPCYIQKATLPNNSPLIVNSEGMNLNQRKMNEYYLRDRSKVPWVVCYIAHNASENNIPVDIEPVKNIPDLETDPSEEAQVLRRLFLNNQNFVQDSNNIILMDQNLQMYFRTRQYYSIWQGNNYYQVELGQANSFLAGWMNGAGQTGGVLDTSLRNLFEVGTDQGDTVYPQFNTLSLNLNNDYDSFWRYIKLQHPVLNTSQKIDGDIPRLQDGKIWKYGDNYYELIEEDYRTETIPMYLDTVSDDYLDQQFKLAFNNRTVASGNKTFKFRDAVIKYAHYRLELREGFTATVDIQANRVHPEEVPYDIIAFPYEPIRVNQWGKDINDVASLAAARSISVALESGCFDVQILPFCPVLNYIDSNGNIELGDPQQGGAVEGIDYCVVKKVDGSVTTRYTLGFYCNSAYQSLTGDNRINKLFDGTNDVNVSDICKISEDGRKIDNECDLWRLSAPNYMAQFDFKLSKDIDINNDAPLDHFDVDITYRPYQPYIRIAPQFGFLYNTDFKDARGLICTAGFSITLVDDKWQTYELNNKNYQAIFNREIQGMEVNRAIAREQEAWNITKANAAFGFGMTAGPLAAGVAGGMTGGIAGAIVGSVGAATGAAYKGTMNYFDVRKQADWAERAFKEQRDFKIDMFNMSLDNIRALPQSITQSSSISNNFKYFPILEYYTCTDEERQMVKNKIRWNGMTVGLISRINDYISNIEERYVQGELIRLDNIADDSHVAKDIYDEVNKGLFFVPEGE